MKKLIQIRAVKRENLCARFRCVAGLSCLCLVFSGCAVIKPATARLGPGYTPENIYTASSTLPRDLKRVVVLPLMADEKYSVLIEGRDVLDPMLTSELIKTRKFEIVHITPESLRNFTGRTGWTGEEVLPEAFFSSLREAYGCDAVLFCQLTRFQAYAPLAVGWRMKLVDARSRGILWAGDELFDAGQSSVKNAAQRYQRAQQQAVDGATSEWIMENSPRIFAQYTVASLLTTLPAR